MFTLFLANTCVVYTAISKMHVFFTEVFPKTWKLPLCFKNEQTNLLGNLKDGHEGSLLIINDNLKKNGLEEVGWEKWLMTFCQREVEWKGVYLS